MIPAVILPTLQRSSMDCGLCCLQMLVDRPYDVVRDEALRVIPHLHERGMYASELTRVARKFGVQLQKRTEWGDEDVGVLDVRGRKGWRHFAVLFKGVLVNPSDGMVWSPDVYLETKSGKAQALYAVVDS